MWHKNEKIDEALIRLCDELCVWEREANRGSTLILIPHESDEKIVLVMNGKPITNDLVTPFSLVNIALKRREKSAKRSQA